LNWFENININYESAGRYGIMIKAKDYPEAEAILKEMQEKVVEYIDSAELEYIDVRQSKVTSYDNNGKVGQVDEFVDGELTKSTEYDKTKEAKSVTEYSSIP